MSNFKRLRTVPTVTDAPEVFLEQGHGELELGTWYWVKSVAKWDGNGREKGEEYEWFGCAMSIGSNYVEIRGVDGSDTRIHLDSYWTRLRREHNPEAVIAEHVDHWRGLAQGLMSAIQALTRRLGVAKSHTIPNGTSTSSESGGTGLITLSGQSNLEAYKRELTVAKEKTLPELHKSLKSAHEELSLWIKAPVLALEASIVPERETLALINDRLFTFGLYAGLAESAVQCCGGEPAPYDSPLHVMQRRMYMDEEALISYEAGGMDFRDIGAFDAWLCRPENRDRILPFPRTLVAMRVRRHGRERETHGDVLAAFINIEEDKADKWTFLYVRNGDQVWRIACEIDFGALIFPEGPVHSEDGPMMVQMFARTVRRMITRSEYEQNLAAYDDLRAKSKEWRNANPGRPPFDDPYVSFTSDSVDLPGFGSFRPHDWEPLDQSNVHLDDALAELAEKAKEYNRVAVIIQGLFDRSEVLQPHPVVQTWRPDSFGRSVKLVYDATFALHDGEKPDFESYRRRLNESLGPGSVVVGQERYWMAREAERENERRDRDTRTGAPRYRYTVYKPQGNPGPGRVATIHDWRPRARTAVFNWERNARRWRGDPVHCTLSVPASEMLNISAYQPGDFRQFFADPRTRAEYLKWAPLLLTAEDWHAGRLRDIEPSNSGGV